MTLTLKEVKYYSSLKQKKYRVKEGKFLIEGLHLVEECLNSSFFIECIVINAKADEHKYKGIVESAKRKHIKSYVLKSWLFDKIAETESSQGIAAVVQLPSDKQKDVPAGISRYNTILVLDRITDPGNLGTIIRTACWFGVGCILLGENSVDPYNAKVIRSTQGALFHVDVRSEINLMNALNDLKGNGFEVYLFSPSAKETLSSLKPGSRNVLVFGNETEGLSHELMEAGFRSVRIEGYSSFESLNVAVSCAIALYALTRGEHSPST